jgi:pilus assembly protein CpaC
MIHGGAHSFCLLIRAALLALLLVTPAIAGIPLEVGLNKSLLLRLNKNVVLVTLASTKKEELQKDVEIVVKTDKAVAENIPHEQKISSNSAPSNTNRFVTLEVLSPTLIKLDGIQIGSTTMIIWLEGGRNKEPELFYDITVTADRALLESQLKDISPDERIMVRFVNETIVLSGMVTNGQTRRKAETMAKAFGLKVISQITTDNPQQVLLQVKVAQVDKTALKKLGISFLTKGKTAEGFSNMIGAPTGGLSGNLAALGSLTPLDTVQLGASYFYGGVSATLQALVTKGLAKILAEPNLLVKSGEEGSFLAGSRIPYTVVATSGGIATSTIVYESVGIKLKFKPEVLENGLINLKIDPAEVSSIAGTMAVNGYPIIDTREVRTSVELKDGESLVLAGLLQEDQINSLSKIPLLGDIPFLGALFRTIQNDLKEKELVFFITPKIVKPLAVGAAQTLPTDRKLTADEKKELQWMPH